jgi:hypothetical protein
MAKYLKVTLGRLVRETATVMVKVLDEAGGDEIAACIYSTIDDELEWEPDVTWGADEGTHTHEQITEAEAEGRCGIVAGLNDGEVELISW